MEECLNMFSKNKTPIYKFEIPELKISPSSGLLRFAEKAFDDLTRTSNRIADGLNLLGQKIHETSELDKPKRTIHRISESEEVPNGYTFIHYVILEELASWEIIEGKSDTLFLLYKSGAMQTIRFKDHLQAQKAANELYYKFLDL